MELYDSLKDSLDANYAGLFPTLTLMTSPFVNCCCRWRTSIPSGIREILTNVEQLEVIQLFSTLPSFYTPRRSQKIDLNNSTHEKYFSEYCLAFSLWSRNPEIVSFQVVTGRKPKFTFICSNPRN